MGLLRAAIVYLVGTFLLSLIDKHLDKFKEIPIIGSLYGDNIQKYVKSNKSLALLFGLTILEFLI